MSTAEARPSFLYILECAAGALYVGWTHDPARRLKQHNGELPGGAAYTRSCRPVKMVALWEFECSLGRILSEEARLKGMLRSAKMKVVRGFWSDAGFDWGGGCSRRQAPVERPSFMLEEAGHRRQRPGDVEGLQPSASSDSDTAQSIAPITLSHEGRENR